MSKGLFFFTIATTAIGCFNIYKIIKSKIMNGINNCIKVFINVEPEL